MTSWNSNSTALPNPDVYLNHLPPDVANQFEIARNFYLAMVGAAIWDILVYIPTDIKIISRGFTPVIFCFIMSRVLAVVYVLLWVVTSTTPIANCTQMIIAMAVVCQLGMATANYLFLRRVQVVYSDNRIVRWFFGFLWVCVSGMSFSVPVGTNGIRAKHIEGTNYCTLYAIAPYTSVAQFLPAAFDTLVFLAISYKLITNHTIKGDGPRWKSFFTGKSLPLVAHALLRGGQQYYFLVFALTIVTGAAVYSTTMVPETDGLVFTLAQSTLTASMACRVYRNLRMVDESEKAMKLPKTVLYPMEFAHDTASASTL